MSSLSLCVFCNLNETTSCIVHFLANFWHILIKINIFKAIQDDLERLTKIDDNSNNNNNDGYRKGTTYITSLIQLKFIESQLSQLVLVFISHRVSRVFVMITCSVVKFKIFFHARHVLIF